MTLLIYILSGILLCLSLFFILSSVLKVPLYSKEKASDKVIKKAYMHNRPSLLDKLTDSLSRAIKLPSSLRSAIEDALMSSGKTEKAEHFVSGLIVRTSPLVLLALVLLLFSPVLSALVFVASLIIPLMGYEEIKKKTDSKRKRIESQLYGFVLYIQKCIKHNRDVIYICESYPSSDKIFVSEMQQTCSDMRSANVESALSRLEKRIGSALLSDVTRGLVSVSRGDETQGYWQSMEIKLRENERLILRTRANKLPSKTRILSMVMLFCFVAIYAVVLGTIVIESLAFLL
ncbi:MAG: hypothetical protein K6F14_06810 [Clostridiales bacterium]|nr:hypothetical protein [Clostridiales bacterium]